MASGDFADLQLQLAYMSGRAAVAGLDAGDLALAKQCINEAYLDCYMNPGGTRPRWALQNFGLQFSAPVTATITVTQGAKTFTGYSPSPTKTGSMVQLGNSWYTFAGQVEGAGGSTDFSPQTGQTALVDGQQSYAITFTTPFATPPTFWDVGLVMISGSAELFSWSVTGITTSGMTVWLSGIPTAASTGSYINWNASGTISTSPTGGDYQFVEPVAEASGSYSATFYHNSYGCDANIIEVEGDPQVLGWGLLSPMNSRGEQARWQQILYGDFTPHAGGGAYMTGGYWPGGINYPTGTPIYYRIENGPMINGNAIKCLFMVEPMPTAITTVQLQGWVVPTELSADADMPIIPGALSSRILLPLCRERWALLYKKYTGGNQEMLMREAGIARENLNRMSGGQRNRPVRVPVMNC